MSPEKILSAAVGNLFFVLAPILTLPIYLYLFIKNRYNFSHPLSVFEIPILLTSKATVIVFAYFVLNYTVRLLGYDNECKAVDWASTAMFYSSTFLITAANNLLMPLVSISCLYFFIGTSGTVRQIFIWTVSTLYVLVKYFTILHYIPNFTHFLFISNVSPKSLIICPFDISLITISMIMLFVRLCCSKHPVGFEELVLVFETISVISIKMFGMLADMLVIGVFSRDPRTILQITEIETEVMLLKNYELDQMTLPYCFILSVVLVKMEDIRRRTTIRIYDQFEGGGPVKWFRFQKGADTQNTTNNMTKAAQ